MLAQRPAVSLIPTATGYDVATDRGVIGSILGGLHDRDVEASAYLPAANGFARELVATFKDLGDAVQFIVKEGVA